MVDKLTEKIPTVYFTAKWVTTYDLLVLDFLGINRLVINSKQKTLTRGGLLPVTVIIEGVIPMKRSANFMDNFTGKP